MDILDAVANYSSGNYLGAYDAISAPTGSTNNVFNISGGFNNSWGSTAANTVSYLGGNSDLSGNIGILAGNLGSAPAQSAYNNATPVTTNGSGQPSIMDRASCVLNTWGGTDAYKACLSGNSNDVTSAASTNPTDIPVIGPYLGRITVIVIGIVVLLAGLFLLRDFVPAPIQAGIAAPFKRSKVPRV